MVLICGWVVVAHLFAGDAMASWFFEGLERLWRLWLRCGDVLRLGYGFPKRGLVAWCVVFLWLFSLANAVFICLGGGWSCWVVHRPISPIPSVNSVKGKSTGKLHYLQENMNVGGLILLIKGGWYHYSLRQLWLITLLPKLPLNPTVTGILWKSYTKSICFPTSIHSWFCSSNVF